MYTRHGIYKVSEIRWVTIDTASTKTTFRNKFFPSLQEYQGPPINNHEVLFRSPRSSHCRHSACSSIFTLRPCQPSCKWQPSSQEPSCPKARKRCFSPVHGSQHRTQSPIRRRLVRRCPRIPFPRLLQGRHWPLYRPLDQARRLQRY